MASVGSLSTSTSTSIRGYGGLASGLDRDELIEGMTIGTTTKINKQEQKKQQIEWMQEAVRTISDKMIGFHSKYTETLTSPTNLFSGALWGRNKITTSGKNSSKVSISGTANSADAITVMGVKQKAENAKWASTGSVSDGKLQTGEINFDGQFKETALEGRTLDFRYGGDGSAQSFSITLKAVDGKDNYDLTTADGVKNAINSLLAKETAGDTKASEIVEATIVDGKLVLTNKTGNQLKLSGGTALDTLGLKKDTDMTGSKAVTGEHGLTADKLYRDVDFAKHVGGKSLTFSYNGTTKSVKIPGENELRNAAETDNSRTAYQKSYEETYKANLLETYATEYQQRLDSGMLEEEAYTEIKTTVADAAAKSTADAAATAEAEKAGKNQAMIDAIADSLEKQLQTAFGKGRIEVSGEGGKLSFTTMIPGQGVDKSSILTLTGGDSALVGKDGALNVRTGESTRLDLNAKIGQSGIDFEGGDSTGTFKINGETFTINSNTTLKSLMDDINKRTDITVSYQEAADKFTLTSKDNGASGSITFDFTKEDGTVDADSQALAEKIFGIDFTTHTIKVGDENVEVFKTSDTYSKDGKDYTVYEDASGNKYNVYEENNKKIAEYKDEDGNTTTSTMTEKTEYSVQGKDAIVSVRYAGSDDIVELHRDSNTFTVDGLTIGVKGTFGEYNTNGKLVVDEDEAVEISADVDVDKLMDTIKSFVTEYNEIVDMVNTELTTKHEKDYTPLSSEQKSELSDDEIEKWEAKAKSGLLYGDSDLRSLSMDLRTVATSYVWQLEQVGINVSSSYSDNGKLSIDETKLRSALETDPEKVQNLFTATAGEDADGKPIYNGVATNLKSVMDKYVKTLGSQETKGILIRKAGSKSSALSMTNNTYYDQLQSIEKLIDSLNDRLKTERDRYVKQFTSLETLISQMNSQSSYLSSMSGY